MNSTLICSRSTETKSDIFAVDVAQMKFNRVFFKSDDFITAIDLNHTRNSVCCANYSGRMFMYDFARRTQVAENRLKLQKRASSTSDTDTFETPHASALAFSHDGCHLLCGLENGSLVVLDPHVLHEMKTLHVSQDRIKAIKFSADSSFVALYVRISVGKVNFELFFVVFAGREVDGGSDAPVELCWRGMDGSGSGALPRKGHLRFAVHFACSSRLLAPETAAAADFSGPRPGEFADAFT